MTGTIKGRKGSNRRDEGMRKECIPAVAPVIT